MTPDRRISRFTLLRISVLKEIRTTFRERSQVAAVLVVFGMLVLILVFRLLPAIRTAQNMSESARRTATTQSTTEPTTEPSKPAITGTATPTTLPAATPAHRDPRTPRSPDLHMSLDATRWVAIGLVSFVGFFFSVGYLFAAVLATFVGEKEGRTLEVLLACPMSDLELYLVKCVSVIVPSAVLATAFAGVATIVLSLAMQSSQRVPVSVIWIAPLLAVPMLALVQAWFVGIGAAISARTETMKGAGQTLGVVLLIICGSLYGIPAALANYGPMQEMVESAAANFFGRGFFEQYAMSLTILAAPAAIFLIIGRLCFRRDRMLT